MIRLTLLTLAGLFLVLAIYGQPDPNAPARPVAAQTAVAAPEPAPPEPAPQPATQPEPAIIQAVSQTAEQAPRFPGPALRPSPEHGSAEEAALAELAPSAANVTILFVTGNKVNFRAGPSTSDRVIGALQGGSPVEAIGPTNAGWVNIRDAQGRVGYMSAQFLSADAPN